MGKFNGVLLASDFDATLTDIRGNIPERNLEAIEYFLSQGGKFTVSTGRTKVGFHNYSEKYINAPVLLGNGATAYDYRKKEYAFFNVIGVNALAETEKLLRRFPNVGAEIYSVNDKVYVINPHEKNINHFSVLKIDDYGVYDKPYEKMFPAVKIMLYAGEESFEVQKYLAESNSQIIKYIRTNGAFVEILSIEAGKGKALLQLANHIGISEDNVYAVGDGSNDVDMLTSATIGFAPKSGEKAALSAADKTVCSCDDGAVADVIAFLDKKYH